MRCTPLPHAVLILTHNHVFQKADYCVPSPGLEVLSVATWQCLLGSLMLSAGRDLIPTYHHENCFSVHKQLSYILMTSHGLLNLRHGDHLDQRQLPKPKEEKEQEK